MPLSKRSGHALCNARGQLRGGVCARRLRAHSGAGGGLAAARFAASGAFRKRLQAKRSANPAAKAKAAHVSTGTCCMRSRNDNARALRSSDAARRARRP